MKLKSILAKPFAGIVHRKIQKEMFTAVADQEKNTSAAVEKRGKVFLWTSPRVGKSI